MAQSAQAGEGRTPGTGEAAERVKKLAAACEECLREAGRCVDEAQQKLLEAGKEAPERIRPQLDDLGRRFSEAKQESERHAASFREKYLSGVTSEDEFRAHLVMLENEYSSRVRIAEEGIRLLLQNLVEHFAGVEQQVKRRCAQAREFIGGWGHPVQEQLQDILRDLDSAEALWRQKVEAREADHQRALEAQRELLQQELKEEKSLRSKDAAERGALKQELDAEQRARAELEARLKGLDEGRRSLEKSAQESESSLGGLKGRLAEAQESARRLEAALESERRLGEQEAKRREGLEAELKAARDFRSREGFEREKLKQELETERRLRSQDAAARKDSQEAQRAAEKKLREAESAQTSLQGQLGEAAESAHRLEKALESERRLRAQEEPEKAALRDELAGERRLRERLERELKELQNLKARLGPPGS